MTPTEERETAAWSCPECGNGVANCQGLRTCLDCEWTRQPPL